MIDLKEQLISEELKPGCRKNLRAQISKLLIGMYISRLEQFGIP